MFYCEDCRTKKNWPDSLMVREKCEVCGKSRQCYDVPAVMLVPETDRTTEQNIILKTVMDAYKEKAESIIITTLDGRTDNLMTKLVRKIFSKRSNEIDWYATYQARLKAQEYHRESERAKRDRRQ